MSGTVCFAGDVPSFINNKKCKYFEPPIVVKEPSDQLGMCYGEIVCTYGQNLSMTSVVGCLALPKMKCPDVVNCAKDSGVEVEPGILASLEERMPVENKDGSSGQSGKGKQR